MKTRNIKTFFKILSLATQYKYWMVLAALMGFLTVGSGIGLMMTSSFIIASAAIQTPIYQLQVAIVGVRFFGISRGVFRYLERYISHEVTFKLLAKFRVWFFKSLEPLIPSKKKDLTSGDLLSRAIEDIESLEHIFVRVISPPFVFVAVAILMFTLLNLFNIKYAVIFIITFVLSAIGIPTLTYFLSRKLGGQIIKLKSQLKAIAVDSIQGLSELIVYGQIQKWKNIFSEIEDDLLRLERKMNLIQSLHEVLTGLAMNITVAIMLYAAIPDVSNKLLNGVYLSVITIGIMASFEIVFQIPLAFQYLTKSVEAGKRLLEITESDQINNLSRDLNLEYHPTAYPKNEIQQIRKYDLKISDITFSYDGNKKALDKISFEVKEREKIAIVGASGSGKSTLVNIICKLWNYDDGEILVGDIGYNNISSEKVREIISVVPQNVHLFTGTILENLLISNENANEYEINEALKKSQLYEYVQSLPEKVNTHIGELGKKLSGGEVKRLGIARAILRNTPIIIFDEVTSHLDSVTEKNILSMIEQISKDKSILFITHRLNQMEMFDEILVMSNGRIIERGNHKDLIKQNGYYKKLLLSQNKKMD